MSEPFLAQITLFAGNFAPRGWALCDGQILPINQYQALFSLLGTTYGGDGRTSFALPDLRGRVPIGEGQGPGLPSRVLGSKSGSQNVVLTPDELPAHTHLVENESTVTGGIMGVAASVADSNVVNLPVGGYELASPPFAVRSYTSGAANTKLGDNAGSATVVNSGGSQAHNNMQPYQALNYIIALQGLFPSRN